MWVSFVVKNYIHTKRTWFASLNLCASFSKKIFFKRPLQRPLSMKEAQQKIVATFQLFRPLFSARKNTLNKTHTADNIIIIIQVHMLEIQRVLVVKLASTKQAENTSSPHREHSECDNRKQNKSKQMRPVWQSAEITFALVERIKTNTRKQSNKRQSARTRRKLTWEWRSGVEEKQKNRWESIKMHHSGLNGSKHFWCARPFASTIRNSIWREDKTEGKPAVDK